MAGSSGVRRLRGRIARLLASKTAEPAGLGWTVAMGGILVLVAVFTSALGFADSEHPAPVPALSGGENMSWLEPVPRVSLFSMAVIAPEEFASNAEILTDDEVGRRLSRFARKKGFHLEHLSDRSVHSGSPMTLQLTMGREGSSLDSPWDGEKLLEPFVGWVIHYQPRAAGENVTLGVRAAYAFLPGNHPAPGLFMRSDSPHPFGTFSGDSHGPLALPGGALWSDVAMATAEKTVTVRSGEIFCISLGEVEPGVHALCLTGVRSRMPWDSTPQLPFLSLAPPPDNAKPPTRVVSYAQTQRLDPDLERIFELRQHLREKVAAHPKNRELLKLKEEFQREAKSAELAQDKDRSGLANWKVTAVILKMEENCRGDFEAEELEIEILQRKRGDKLGREFRDRIEKEKGRLSPSGK